MFWKQWYLATYGDQSRVPPMDQATFLCALCGKNHLSTHFEHGLAKFPTTATTARNGVGEWYILCVDREQAKQKESKKDAQAAKQCGDGYDSCGRGEGESLPG